MSVQAKHAAAMKMKEEWIESVSEMKTFDRLRKIREGAGEVNEVRR